MATSKTREEAATPIRVGRKLGNTFEQLEERVRERAYQIFLGRDTGESDPIGDWLEAQLQLVTPVELELKEQKKNIVVEASLKGFTPKEIEIEVGPGDLKVFGSHTESSSKKKGDTTRSSSETVHFYQAMPLPCEVDPDASEAKLFKNGKLRITLPKKT